MQISVKELTGALLALLLFVFGGIIWTNRTTANAEIVSGMESILSNVSASTTTRSEAFLSEARASSEIAALAMSQGALESDADLESYFGSVLRTTPSANGMFFGTVGGDFLFVSRAGDSENGALRTKVITVEEGERTVELIDRDLDFNLIGSRLDPEDNYDPRVRPWFQASIEADGTVVTDPYVFFTSQRPGITAASPVYGPADKIAGVVGVDVDLSDLSTFLSDLSLGANGSAFIFNTAGEIIALEDLDRIQQLDGDGFRLSSVYELDSTVLVESYEASTTVGSEPKPFTIDDGGSTLHASVAPIEQTDWILGVALDERDFLSGVRAEQQRSNLIALALGLVAIVVSWRLIENVTGPLRELRRRALDIESGNLVETEPSTAAIEELRATSDAFDQMVSRLLEQREKNAELIADLESRAGDRPVDPAGQIDLRGSHAPTHSTEDKDRQG